MFDVASVQGTVAVFGDVTDLNPLVCLRAAGGLNVFMATSLLEIPDLPRLRDVPRIEISSSPLLESVGVIGVDGELEVVGLRGLPSLGSFGGVPGAESARVVAVVETGLGDLGFFESIAVVENLGVTGNPNLQSISGLGSLRQVEVSLMIDANPALTPCEDWKIARQLENEPQELTLQTPVEDCPE